MSIENHFELFKQKMQLADLSEIAIKNFEYNYRKLLSGDNGQIPSAEIETVSDLPHLNSLKMSNDNIDELVSKVCIIKLNGGLGTSMGLEKAKSLLPAIGAKSFLDIIVNQVVALRKNFQAEVPLLFMNSFRTEFDTLNVLRQNSELVNGNRGISLSFLQSKVPKIDAESYQPAISDVTPELEWCPPGHGEIYTVLSETGMLSSLLDKGIKYAFISNADNLAAILDPRVIQYLEENNIPFLMEVATRTKADRKGGHLAQDSSGALLLREVAQCPSQDVDDFQDHLKYSYFNTNSLWVNLHSLQKILIERESILGLSFIRNNKPLDPTRKDSTKVIQLETAMGSAISVFKDAKAVHVDRDRFLPIKTTDQLLELGSDRYSMNDVTYQIASVTSKSMDIDIDSRFYSNVDEFKKRFSKGIPSLKECTSLKIDGDIFFGKGVVCKGDVHLVNRGTSSVCVEDQIELNGKIDLT